MIQYGADDLLGCFIGLLRTFTGPGFKAGTECADQFLKGSSGIIDGYGITQVQSVQDLGCVFADMPVCLFVTCFCI